MKLKEETAPLTQIWGTDLRKVFTNNLSVFYKMKIPPNILHYIQKNLGDAKCDEIKRDWFYLTLDNFKYLQDGDLIGFIDCKTGSVQTGHIFHKFSDDWSKMFIYYSTLRRLRKRITTVDIDKNLFFFKKVVHSDEFCIYYMLNGLETGGIVVDKN